MVYHQSESRRQMDFGRPAPGPKQEDEPPTRRGPKRVVRMVRMMSGLFRQQRRSPIFAVALTVAALAATTATAGQPPAEPTGENFAVVDGEVVTMAEFRSFLVQFARNRFYHNVSEEQLAAVEEAAAEALVWQRLLAQEAERQGLPGDPQAVSQRLDAYEQQYRGSPSWPAVERQWPLLRRRLLEMTKVTMLEEQVRRVEPPREGELVVYYRDHLPLFTEPEQLHLWVILLGVDPSAGAEAWQAGADKAAQLAAELAAGADFADLAREYSTHGSIGSGGDLGFVHRGVLSDPAQDAVDRLEPGGISPPVRVLEGYALFRLIERRLPRVSRFVDVRDRIEGLYTRDRTDRQWSDFLAELRAGAEVVIHRAPHAASQR